MSDLTVETEQANDWVEYYDEGSQATYYFNTVTGKLFSHLQLTLLSELLRCVLTCLCVALSVACTVL